MWANELTAALARSKAVVAIITKYTRVAHYQISELQRAVDLHRKIGTKLFVLKHSEGELPLGLEQFQAVTWSGSQVDAAISEMLAR